MFINMFLIPINSTFAYAAQDICINKIYIYKEDSSPDVDGIEEFTADCSQFESIMNYCNY